MDFRKHIQNAWNLTLQYLSALVLITLVMAVALVYLPLILAAFSMPLLGLLTICILAPAMLPGYIQSLLRMVGEDRRPQIEDLFAQMHLFIPLLIFSIVVGITIFIGFKLLFLPGIAILCLLTFGCLYMLPLMIDRKIGLSVAVKSIWQMAIADNIADHMVVVFLVIGLAVIGLSVIVGTLFTLPFATILVLSVYKEKTSAGRPSTDSINP